MKNESLVINNLNLAYSRASYFSTSNIDLEELKSIARFGLVKAAISFKYSKNVKFSTYATRVIDNEIKSNIRKNMNYINHFGYASLEETIKDGITLKDMIPSKDCNIEDKYIEKEQFLSVINEIKSFSKRDIEMVYLCIFKEYTTSRIGEILGLSQSYISRRLRLIYEKVRNNLEIEPQKNLTIK